MLKKKKNLVKIIWNKFNAFSKVVLIVRDHLKGKAIRINNTL